MIYQNIPITGEEIPETAQSALFIKFDNDVEVPIIFSNSKELSFNFNQVEDLKHTSLVFTDPNTGKQIALTLRRYNG